jgi:hypothetical protein
MCDEHGCIGEEDYDFIDFCDDPEEAVNIIKSFHRKHGREPLRPIRST